ncbi:MAG: hypothetical protein JWN00_2345, partial [Actinomycetia bacterium]|nr:hypothetical protein [Actinomycetes bacterium]
RTRPPTLHHTVGLRTETQTGDINLSQARKNQRHQPVVSTGINLTLMLNAGSLTVVTPK